MDFSITCISNGYDLDAFYDLIYEQRIKSLQITIDGGETVHNARRCLAGGQPTFRKIVENINKCLDTGIKIELRSNINSENFQEIEKILNLAEENGWTNYPNFSRHFKATHSCNEKPVDNISDVHIMKEIQRLHPNFERFSLHNNYRKISKDLRNILEKGMLAPFQAGYCASNGRSLTVDPFGDIYSCWSFVGESEELIGTINNKTRMFEFNSRYDYWENRTADKIKECLECRYALFCGGGCPAIAKYNNGDIYSANCNNFATIFNEVLPALYQDYSSSHETVLTT